MRLSGRALGSAVGDLDPGLWNLEFSSNMPLTAENGRSTTTCRTTKKVDLHNYGVSDIAEKTFLKSETSGSTRSIFTNASSEKTIHLHSRAKQPTQRVGH